MKEAETENILVPCIIDRILKNNMRHAKVCNEIIRDPGSLTSWGQLITSKLNLDPDKKPNGVQVVIIMIVEVHIAQQYQNYIDAKITEIENSL